MNKTVSAEIWFIKHAYYMRAYSITTTGMGYANNPVHIVSADNVAKLGNEILQTFKECKFGIPHPDHRIKEKDEMLEIIGVKTEKEQNQKGRMLTIFFEAMNIRIHPWFFDGKYMTGSKDLPDMYCSPDPDDITKTVLLAFEKIEAFQK